MSPELDDDVTIQVHDCMLRFAVNCSGERLRHRDSGLDDDHASEAARSEPAQNPPPARGSASLPVRD